MKEKDEETAMPVEIVMKPIKNAQGQVTGYNPVEVSKEMADAQIGKWKAFEAGQSKDKGNPSWIGVRFATDAEKKAFEKLQKKADK